MKHRVGQIRSHNGVLVCFACKRDLRGEHRMIDTMRWSVCVCPQNEECVLVACVRVALEEPEPE